MFLIQKAQNKDSLAIQLKLNELVAAHEFASNRLVDIENIPEEELKVIQKYYSKLIKMTKDEETLQQSYSIDEAKQMNEIKKGTENIIKESLNFNAGFKYSDMTTTTITTLINAARSGNTVQLKEMITDGVSLNVHDEKGYTPLIIACYNNHPEAAKLLLENGADVNDTDLGGNTALMGASFKGYPAIAALLIENGADLNLQHGNGGTALMFAAMFGRNELVDLLLRKGADPTIVDVRGLSVVELAAQQGNQAALDLLQSYL